MKNIHLYTLLLLFISVVGCQSDKKTEAFDHVKAQKNFQQLLNGKQVNLYTIKNGQTKASITNYGGRIVSLIVPDANGNPRDVVLGYSSLDGYLTSSEVFYGALIGRVGNRIANGQFTLDSAEYTLPQNNGPNTLHGGPKGFHNVVWDVKQATESTITLSYTSADMEQGFPGELVSEVTYEITNNNELQISYKASTNKLTVVNLTNHAFFNLNGDGSGSINQHQLQINAAAFTPVDSTLIPIGPHRAVADTPFDFTAAKPIGKDLSVENTQLVYGKGYDHNFVLDKGITKTPELATIVTAPKSGIKMEVLTTEPGLQFYGGNFMDGSDKGKNGTYDFRTAFCLETQHFPDSPNQGAYPSITLKPEEQYTSKTLYRFSVVK